MSFMWPADYNPELSMKTAMVEAAAQMELTNGTMTTEAYMARVAGVDMWTRIAQVHATNMQTEAIRSARKPACRCVN